MPAKRPATPTRSPHARPARPRPGKDTPPAPGRATRPPAAPVTLARFRPLARNPNTHTPRGLAMLEDAIQRDGYVSPMTAAADGTVIDGNARLETVAHALPSDPIVIEHDGTRPIIAIRTDIPNADDPRAKRIAVAANRIASVDLAWDAEVLASLQSEEIGLDFLWDASEFKVLLKNLSAPIAPEAFPVVDESLAIDHECPKCGYRWSGKS